MHDTDMTKESIPVYGPPKTKDIHLFRKIEKMILLQELEDNRIIHEPIYHNFKVDGSIAECYFRQNVGERLQIAASHLPDGYKLKIFDAWRPPQVQMSLYAHFRKQVAEINTTDSDEEIDRKTRLVFSYPSKDQAFPYAHATGGAIDLTVVDALGKELNMGTSFDDFVDMSVTAYYESLEGMSKNDVQIRNNRRLLYHSMTAAGFSNLPSKWWHYDYGNFFWAYYAKDVAVYGAFRK